MLGLARLNNGRIGFGLANLNERRGLTFAPNGKRSACGAKRERERGRRPAISKVIVVA